MSAAVFIIFCGLVFWAYLYERKLYLDFVETFFKEFPDKRPKSEESNGDKS
jgi:hypothetical protein